MTTLIRVDPRELVRSVRPRNYRAIEALYDLEPGTLRKAREENHQLAIAERARNGDWRALPQLSSARELLRREIDTDTIPKLITQTLRVPRGVGGLAKEFLRARRDKVKARMMGDAARWGEPNRIFFKWIAKLKARAVTEGVRYHHRVNKLYVSKRADVVYGKGGQEERDAEAYSKGYRQKFGGDKWLNAGARLDSETRPTCIIIENYRGTEVARVSLRKEV